MKDNYCVIMGGGIGSRFWPFSRESYPKQFLDFFGTGRSLLQMTFDRFSKIIPIENIYIVTNEQYASLVKEQLPELGKSQILLEPARRNTAPCIAYAAYHIKACIMEKADNVYMLCVDFGWADLGTWGSLFDLAKKDEQNNALLKSEAIMYESNGNIVALDNPKRLTVIQGINDCIVAESGNVLLICKKEDEQRIKQFVADAQMKYGKEFN